IPAPGHAGMFLLQGYAQAGNVAEADALLEELLAEARKSSPKDSLALAETLHLYAAGLFMGKAFAAAEPLLRECLAIRVKKQPCGWTTHLAQWMPGAALTGQSKHAEAEAMLLKAHAGMTASLGSAPPEGRQQLRNLLDRLIELYTAMNEPEKVKEWQAERE